MLFHSTIPHNILSPFPFFLSTPTPRKLLSLHILNSQQHVLGDSLVFEDGIFEDPFLQHNINSHNLTKSKKKKKKRNAAPPQIVPENLVPEKWREIQAQINIAKKESMKISQEMEFNTKVEKKSRALILLKDLNMDQYKAYKEAKLAQLNPLVLDNPSSFRVKEEDFVEKEQDGVDEFGGTERVKPKNPRWAVYGRSLKDVSEFLNSDIYDSHANNITEGRQNLLTKEEKVLLRRGMLDLARATSNKWLPLHTLAACGEFYLVDSLMKHNVDINAVDKDGLTALHKAIIGKNQAVTNYLLINSANPFVKDKDRATLMHYAVQTASSQTIKILLLYNVDINRQDKDGWTPLHLAVQTQRTDLVRLLLINGADKALKNKDGLTPLDLCLYLGQGLRTYELIKLLKQKPQS